MTDHGPWHLRREGRSARVVIDHPPLNIVDGALLMGLRSLLDDLETDPPNVVVFTSADPDFFLMHGDVALLAGIGPSAYAPSTTANLAAATFDRLRTAPFLSIGVLDGAARGGGAELLAALDLRIGSSRAVLGQPEVAMGILPGAGGTARLPHLLGRGRALAVVLTGRDATAQEALSIGWLDVVVEPAELTATVGRLAARIAKMPQASVAAVKQVMDASLTAGIAAGLVAESDALARLMSTGAHQSPMRRYLAAGGQTRDGETTRMAEIMDQMLGEPVDD